MPDPPVYIAGIGVSPWSWPRTSLSLMQTKSAVHQLAISAGTKALLDAGISYDHVDQAIGFGDLKGDNDVFYTFGKTGIPIHHKLDNESGLFTAVEFIKNGNSNCVLMIGLDQTAAVAMVLGSETFLWRHPYLKDAAAAIRGCGLGSPMKGSPTMKFVVQEAFNKANLGPSDVQIVESNSKSALDDLDLARNIRTWSSSTSLLGLCEIVWLLRGWTHSEPASKIQTCLQCTIGYNGTATATILSRADGKAAPAFKEAEQKNDGRDRLGYNPAMQTNDITIEDWESIKSREEFSDERAVDKVGFRRKGGDRAALAKL